MTTPSTPPPTCPKCGAEMDSWYTTDDGIMRYGFWWRARCGTFFHPVNALVQTEYCIARQEISTLRARVAELEAEISQKNAYLDEVLERADKKLARIKELEAAHRWIPVGERLPPKAELILLWCEGEGFLGDTRASSAWSDAYLADWLDRIGATHWQPLPAPPEEKE